MSGLDAGDRCVIAQALVDESSNALMAVRPDGCVLFWNRGAQAMYGYSREEIEGRDFVDLIVPTAHRDAARRALQQAIETGALEYDAARRRRNGSTIEVAVALRRLALPDASVGVAIRYRDRSDSQSVKDLRASEARFKDLFEFAPDAIITTDRGGRIVIVNAQSEKLFGYRRSELLGQSVEMLLPEVLGLRGRRKDGTEFSVEISLSPLQTGGDTLVSSAIRDVSERRRLEDGAHEASRLKSEFLASMSHELRTPLNTIIGFSELMYDGKVGPMAEDHREFLGDILTSARHLLLLINDVLDLAKIEAGKIEFHSVDVDLSRLATDACDALRGLAADKRLDVSIDVDAGVGRVTVDPGRLTQILYNYLSNAIKFTPEGGRIDVRVTPEGPAHFRVDVADTGVGIADEHLGRLFVEFQQLGSGSGQQYQGTGLGLALTKRLAEAQGGRVSVRSAVGKGSTFSVILPRKVGVPADEPPERARGRPGR